MNLLVQESDTTMLQQGYGVLNKNFLSGSFFNYAQRSVALY
jgi:hypothetical protein